MAELLRRFYGEARTKKKEHYSKLALINLRAGISRHITSPPHSRVMNIVSGTAFKQANMVFKGQLRTLKIKGLDRTQYKVAMIENYLTCVRNHLKANMSSPRGLLNKVIFDILYFFGRRGREGLRQLKRDSFVFQRDGEGHEYATLAYIP